MMPLRITPSSKDITLGQKILINEDRQEEHLPISFSGKTVNGQLSIVIESLFLRPFL